MIHLIAKSHTYLLNQSIYDLFFQNTKENFGTFSFQCLCFIILYIYRHRFTTKIYDVRQICRASTVDSQAQ